MLRLYIFVGYQANNGRGDIIVLTFLRVSMITSSSIVHWLPSGLMLLMTLSIISTITGISASLRPRVVIAGVPMRRPDVWNGVRESNGTMFLLTVMSALTRVF